MVSRSEQGGCVCVLNQITNVSPFQVLEVDNNSIQDLDGLYHLPRLEEVVLKNNSILEVKSHLSFGFWIHHQ